MSCKVVLSSKFKDAVSETESLTKLSEKGIDSYDDFEKKLLLKINKVNKLNIDNIIYTDEKLDKYSGYILNQEEKKLAYFFVVPPKLGTRSGFITQQVFGAISNSLNDKIDSISYNISNLPVYVVNCDVDEINLSKAQNIVGAKILGFRIVDLYDRTENEVLLDKVKQTNFKTLVDYDKLISRETENEYFQVDVATKKIKFLKNRLKNLTQALTNEPYYFAIKAYPALFLASQENYEIDIIDFHNWYTTGSNTNKNVEAFYLYAKKIIEQKKSAEKIIYYGAPGTGKSYKIDQKLEKNKIEEEFVFRTTFHPEYTYSDFIGQLLPVIEERGTGDKTITYSFKKGVFTRALEKAYEDTSKNVYLVLEEMSRGDVAAIFGDVFQLLDRVKTGVKSGYSRYFINNDAIANDIIAIDGDKVKLPPNLFIYGTVNTSDQNVFAMDTAFKRRFDWEYISTKPVKNNDSEYLNNSSIELKIGDDDTGSFEWVVFYQALNKFISHKDFLELGEDKQIGQFFIEFKNDGSLVKNQIKNKLLQYLWDDVQKASFKRNVNLFSDEVNSFSDLYHLYEKDEKVFSNKFIDCLKEFSSL